METNKPPLKRSEIRALLHAKEKFYYEAIQNSVEFEKLKTLQETIQELRLLLSNKKKEK